MAETQTVERRCILSRQSDDRAELLRLVRAPDGAIVPDVAEKLPGRGAWISLNAAALDEAQKNGSLAAALSRAFKARIEKADIADSFVSDCLLLLKKRALDRLGQMKRSGDLTLGFDNVKAALKQTPITAGDLLVLALDAGQDGRKKIDQLSAGVAPVIASLDRDDLSMALGKENVVHALARSSKATKLLHTALRRYDIMKMGPLPRDA